LLIDDRDAAEAIHPAIRHRTAPELWRETHVEVLTETPSLSSDPPKSYEHPLVPFNALGANADAFIARWWVFYQELGTAATFLISALGSRLFLDHRFLTEMSFLESYHRARHDKPAIPPDTHEVRRGRPRIHAG
jgi:hypothetical protein